MQSQPISTRSDTKQSIEVELTSRAFHLPPVLESNLEQWSTLPTTRLFQPIQPKTLPFDPTKPVSNTSSKSSMLQQSHGSISGVEYHEAVEPSVLQSSVNSLSIVDADAKFAQPALREYFINHKMKQLEKEFSKKLINFVDVVDLDDEAYRSHVSEDLAGRLVNGNFFQTLITVLILLNSLSIALETNRHLLHHYGGVFTALDNIFVASFALEIFLKFYVDFRGFWHSGWNVFDFCLVASAIFAPALTFMSSGRMLRVLRIFRAFKALRNVSALEGIRSIVNTIISSIPDMLNVGLLLALLMFIYAVVGVTLFKQASKYYFGDLGSAMFALFIVLTQDGWQDIFDALENQGQWAAAVPYFSSFILIGVMIFANLMVGVVVTSFEQSYEHMRDSKKAKMRALTSKQVDSVAHPPRQVMAFDDKFMDICTQQLPLELPKLDSIPKKAMQDYATVLKLMEDNMKEYKTLKDSLEQVLAEVKELNVKAGDELAAEDDESDIDEEEDLANDDLGDPLSRMMNLKKQAKSGGRQNI